MGASYADEIIAFMAYKANLDKAITLINNPSFIQHIEANSPGWIAKAQSAYGGLRAAMDDVLAALDRKGDQPLPPMSNVLLLINTVQRLDTKLKSVIATAKRVDGIDYAEITRLIESLQDGSAQDKPQPDTAIPTKAPIGYAVAAGCAFAALFYYTTARPRLAVSLVGGTMGLLAGFLASKYLQK